MALRRNISTPVRVTDLVEASKDMASLVVSTRQKFFAWGYRFFASDVTSGVLLDHLGPLCLDPGRQLLDGSILLKFILETRL